MVKIIAIEDTDSVVINSMTTTLNHFDVSYDIETLAPNNMLLDQLSTLSKKVLTTKYQVIIVVSGTYALAASITSYIKSLKPVIWLPLSSKIPSMGDFILSLEKGYKNIPILSVGIDAGEGAALAALSIIALSDKTIMEKLKS